MIGRQTRIDARAPRIGPDADAASSAPRAELWLALPTQGDHMSRIPASVRTRPHARPFLAFVTAALASWPMLAVAQGRRALAIEDYYAMKNVGAPLMSADGRWVAFDVTTRVEANNGTDSEVWLVPADGSTEARRVSPAGVFANAPLWREDGRLRFNAAGHAATIDPAEPDRIDTTLVDAAAR